MLDNKIKINIHTFETLNKDKELNIKFFSDIGHNSGFNNDKLDMIVEHIKKTPTNYVCIGGDIIDSTNHIRENKENELILLRFLENLAKDYKTIITLGNHDLFKKTNYGWDSDFCQFFWKNVNNINNVYVSHFNRFYEDENIIIYYPNLDFYYYENYKKQEDITKFWDLLIEDKEYLENLNNEKIKIFLFHSPMMLEDPIILKFIKNFDLVLCGHMHRGLMLPILNELVKNNKGIISPYGEWFPDNARGVKILNFNDINIPLIITGGITKISSSVPLGNIINKIYPMEIEDIKLLTKKKKID